MSTWLRNNRLPALAALALVLLGSAIVLIAYVVPEDVDQGLSQKIFYFHVPIALTAYALFGWGAWKALLHLWRRDPDADLESYVAIHLGVIFGVLSRPMIRLPLSIGNPDSGVGSPIIPAAPRFV